MTTPADGSDAVLTAALEEELRQEHPPELWPLLADRPPPRRRGARWATAALVLGIGVVATVFWTTTGPRERAEPTPLPSADAVVAQDPARDPDGPRTTAELRAWLEPELDRVAFEAVSVWATSLDTAVPVRAHPLDGLFTRMPQILLDPGQRAGLRDALRAAAPAELELGKRSWEYTAELRAGAHSLRLLVAGSSHWPPRPLDAASPPIAWSVAVASPTGALGLAADPTVLAALRPRLAELTRETLVRLDLAIGDEDLATLPDSHTRLRCYGVSAAAAEQLLRFDHLASLDLRASPGLHDTAALRHLRHLPLTSLQLDGSLLDADGVRVLAELRTLTELFVWPAAHAWPLPGPAATATAVDDDAVAAIATLPALRELGLAGATLTDDGLRHLADLDLRNLWLTDCRSVRGAGLDAFEGRGLRDLGLLRTPIDAAGWAAVAALPGLRQLVAGGATPPADLRALRTAPALTKILWNGPLPEACLRDLAALAELTRLSLYQNPTLDDDSLQILAGADKLANLEIADCPKVTDAGAARLQKARPGLRVQLETWQ